MIIYYWLFIPFIIICIIITVSLLFKFNKQIFVPASLSFLAFAALFYLSTQSFGSQLNQLLATISIVLAVYSIIEALKYFSIHFIIQRRNFKLPLFVLDIFGWLITIIITLAIGYYVFGFQIEKVLLPSSIITIGIGWILQGMLDSILSGIVLQIETPFVTGDWVKVDGQEVAQIVKQNWRTLTVLTRHKNHILIPNNIVAGKQLTNFSRPTRLQLQDTVIEIPVEHSPQDVKAVLSKAVINAEGVLRNPRPQVEVIKYGTNTLSYCIKYWINDFGQKDAIFDTVLTYVWYALKRANMAKITSAESLIIKEEARNKQQQQIMILMRSIPLLAQLTDEQLDLLASTATLNTYAPGEYIITQGEYDEVFFIIQSGFAGAYHQDENGFVMKDGKKLEVASFKTNDFFGDISLFKKQPYSASILAKTETVTLEINKASFAEILLTNRSLLQLILTRIYTRRENVMSDGYFPLKVYK